MDNDSDDVDDDGGNPDFECGQAGWLGQAAVHYDDHGDDDELMTMMMMTLNFKDNHNYANYDDDFNIDSNAKQVSPLGQDAVQLKVEDETESHAWFVQLYHDYLMLS